MEINKEINREALKRLNKLSADVIMILDIMAYRGCYDKTWDGFCNGNGTDIGNDFNKLIKRAHKDQLWLNNVNK